MKVNLNYFKPSSGKFYADGEFDVSDGEKVPMFLIHEHVETLIREAQLPGLQAGHSDSWHCRYQRRSRPDRFSDRR